MPIVGAFIVPHPPIILTQVGRGEEKRGTGLKKLGAVLGDYAEIGCNCVLNPGTIVGRNTSAYPLTALRGIYPADSIIKAADKIVKRNK